MRHWLGDRLIDLGEFLKNYMAQRNGARNYREGKWLNGKATLICVVSRCREIDERYGTHFASSPEISARNLLVQYEFFRKYCSDRKAGREAIREAVGYLAMVANLERRFRQSQFYEPENLENITRLLFEQGVNCFELMGLGREPGYSYPKTLEDFLEEYSGVIENLA